MKRAALVAGAALVALVAGCSTDSDVVDKNIAKDAENFKIERRIVFYNGITGDYVLSIEGLCSVDPEDANRVSVTCKTGANEYKKHLLGRSDNVTWFAEQLDSAHVSPDHYEVIFKPSVIVPTIEGR